MDISPKLYEQYCTYYVPLPSSPILLVAVKTLELLGGAVCLLVQFQSAQAGIALATDVTVVDLLTPCKIVVNIRETTFHWLPVNRSNVSFQSCIRLVSIATFLTREIILMSLYV